MATAGSTTLSTSPTTLHNASAGDSPVSEVVLFNTSATIGIMVNVAPLHASGDFLTIPPTPATAVPPPVYLKCKGHQIRSIIAKAASAGSPVLNWSVSET